MYTRINQCQDHKINFRDKMKKKSMIGYGSGMYYQ